MRTRTVGVNLTDLAEEDDELVDIGGSPAVLVCAVASLTHGMIVWLNARDDVAIHVVIHVASLLTGRLVAAVSPCRCARVLG